MPPSRRSPEPQGGDMLTFAEEILLLLLDDENGAFVPVNESTRDCALAGAVLMDLAFANRIDTDPSQLVVSDPPPDRTSVVYGKSVYVRVDLGGLRTITKQTDINHRIDLT